MTILGTAVLSGASRGLKELVQERGSEGFDEDSIKKLINDKPELLDIGPSSSEWGDSKKATIDIIIKELRNSSADTSAEEKENLKSFERKFFLKMSEVKNAVQETVIRESDRVILTIKDVVIGPRNLIEDVSSITHLLIIGFM